MGTEVVRPHDLLSSRRLGGSSCTAAAALLPRRRQTPTSSPGSSPNPTPTRRAEPRKRREGSPRPAKNSGGRNGMRSGGLEMGQVTILKRGESLDSNASGTIRGKAQEEEERRGGAEGAGVLSSVASGDLIVFGTGRIGPERGGMPKQIRVAKAKTGAKASGPEKYAGSAFSSSPSPRALPLPTFSCKRAAECCRVAVDLSATRDLRRLLRLD